MNHEIPNITMREALELITSICRGRSANHIIRRLLNEGLLSETQCRAFLVRHKVKELTARGHTKLDAMERVAEELGASYGTVRSYVYGRYNPAPKEN